jgi:hypothetical protein
VPDLTVKDPDLLSHVLDRMSAAAVQRHSAKVESLLSHRSTRVRISCANALGRAGIGALALRERLGRERSPVVLAEICDSLAIVRDEASLPQLRRLAKSHRSQIVRSYALMAIGDVAKRASVAYLTRMRARDPNRRVRAAVDCVLLALGAEGALSAVLKDLEARDPLIRASVANLLSHYAPRRNRRDLVACLRQVAESEEFAGVKASLEEAIRTLSPK